MKNTINTVINTDNINKLIDLANEAKEDHSILRVVISTTCTGNKIIDVQKYTYLIASFKLAHHENKHYARMDNVIPNVGNITLLYDAHTGLVVCYIYVGDYDTHTPHTPHEHTDTDTCTAMLVDNSTNEVKHVYHSPMSFYDKAQAIKAMLGQGTPQEDGSIHYTIYATRSTLILHKGKVA